MTIDAQTLASVIAELAPLAGGRIQRVDLVAERELVLELRYPGRTIRILVSARTGAGRVHAVADRPPRELPGGDLQRALRKRLEGRPLVALAAEKKTVFIDARDARLSIRLDGGKRAIEALPPSGAEPPPMPEPSALPERFPVSEEIAVRYGSVGTGADPEATRAASAAAAGRLRAEILRALTTRRQKQARLAANLERDRDRLERMKDARAMGEHLKTMLSRIPRGAREAKAHDWATGEEVVIPLDPALGPKQNMERLFARAKKAERGAPIVADRLARAQAELRAFDALRAEVERTDDPEKLVELAEARSLEAARMKIAGLEEPRGAAAEPKKSAIDRVSRRFVASDGTEIRVGKGAKENDRLTFAFARGDDVWMHASGTAGAHVIVRVQKGATASAEAMADAATLAAHYSGASKEARVDVTWTEARYVKKHKGDPPGRVSVAKARTIVAIVEGARLERLFGRSV